MTLSEWADVATVIASIAAVAALFYAAWQIRQNTAIACGQFWLQLEQMFSAHDEVHLKLRPRGAWAGGVGGPQTPQDWAKVEDYMGLFEHCEIMLDRGLIDPQTFKEIFGYRLNNLVANAQIVEAKLVKAGHAWKRFHELLNRMDIRISAQPAVAANAAAPRG
jgi:hypothetical protein